MQEQYHNGVEKPQVPAGMAPVGPKMLSCAVPGAQHGAAASVFDSQEVNIVIIFVVVDKFLGNQVAVVRIFLTGVNKSFGIVLDPASLSCGTVAYKLEQSLSLFIAFDTF